MLRTADMASGSKDSLFLELPPPREVSQFKVANPSGFGTGRDTKYLSSASSTTGLLATHSESTQADRFGETPAEISRCIGSSGSIRAKQNVAASLVRKGGQLEADSTPSTWSASVRGRVATLGSLRSVREHNGSVQRITESALPKSKSSSPAGANRKLNSSSFRSSPQVPVQHHDQPQTSSLGNARPKLSKSDYQTGTSQQVAPIVHRHQVESRRLSKTMSPHPRTTFPDKVSRAGSGTRIPSSQYTPPLANKKKLELSRSRSGNPRSVIPVSRADTNPASRLPLRPELGPTRIPAPFVHPIPRAQSTKRDSLNSLQMRLPVQQIPSYTTPAIFPTGIHETGFNTPDAVHPFTSSPHISPQTSLSPTVPLNAPVQQSDVSTTLANLFETRYASEEQGTSPLSTSNTVKDAVEPDVQVLAHAWSNGALKSTADSPSSQPSTSEKQKACRAEGVDVFRSANSSGHKSSGKSTRKKDISQMCLTSRAVIDWESCHENPKVMVNSDGVTTADDNTVFVPVNMLPGAGFSTSGSESRYEGSNSASSGANTTVSGQLLGTRSLKMTATPGEGPALKTTQMLTSLIPQKSTFELHRPSSHSSRTPHPTTSPMQRPLDRSLDRSVSSSFRRSRDRLLTQSESASRHATTWLNACNTVEAAHLRGSTELQSATHLRQRVRSDAGQHTASPPSVPLSYSLHERAQESGSSLTNDPKQSAEQLQPLSATERLDLDDKDVLTGVLGSHVEMHTAFQPFGILNSSEADCISLCSNNEPMVGLLSHQLESCSGSDSFAVSEKDDSQSMMAMDPGLLEALKGAELAYGVEGLDSPVPEPCRSMSPPESNPFLRPLLKSERADPSLPIIASGGNDQSGLMEPQAAFEARTAIAGTPTPPDNEASILATDQASYGTRLHGLKSSSIPQEHASLTSSSQGFFSSDGVAQSQAAALIPLPAFLIDQLDSMPGLATSLETSIAWSSLSVENSLGEDSSAGNAEKLADLLMACLVEYQQAGICVKCLEAVGIDGLVRVAVEGSPNELTSLNSLLAALKEPKVTEWLLALQPQVVSLQSGTLASLLSAVNCVPSTTLPNTADAARIACAEGSQDPVSNVHDHDHSSFQTLHLQDLSEEVGISPEPLASTTPLTRAQVALKMLPWVSVVFASGCLAFVNFGGWEWVDDRNTRRLKGKRKSSIRLQQEIVTKSSLQNSSWKRKEKPGFWL